MHNALRRISDYQGDKLIVHTCYMMQVRYFLVLTIEVLVPIVNFDVVFTPLHYYSFDINGNKLTLSYKIVSQHTGSCHGICAQYGYALILLNLNIKTK